MQYSTLECIEILPNSEIDFQRENGITHTPYETEIMFFTSIKSGDVKNTGKMMEELLKSKIVVGKLSSDNLRQMQYWAVCCITLATRYAIQGGLDETQAFNYSDKCINDIDNMKSAGQIFNYLQSECIHLTELVSQNTEKSAYPYPVRKSIHYINTNLHSKITLDILSSQAYVSSDYLSVLFKRNVGMSINDYIKKKRLEEAKDLLSTSGKYSISEIAYQVGFCSESYFIKCFKNEYKITPNKFKDSLNA